MTTRAVELEFKQALVDFKEKAEQGDAKAQYGLASHYEHILYQSLTGEERRDPEEILALYRQSAEQGYADAQFKLARRYFNGKGVPQDDSKGIYWLQQSAEQGYHLASYTLGELYQYGVDFPLDDKKSQYYYQRAKEGYQQLAEQGDADAQIFLGRLYLNGEIAPQDDSKGIYWLQQAAEQGSFSAQSELADLYYYGKGYFEHYKGEVDYAQALIMYKKLVVHEDYIREGLDYRELFTFERVPALGKNLNYMIGMMYKKGEGVQQDPQEAVSWFEKASSYVGSWDRDAAYELGLASKNGEGLAQNDDVAFQWFKKSAEQGSAAAQYNLGLMYEEGRGVPREDMEMDSVFKRLKGWVSGLMRDDSKPRAEEKLAKKELIYAYAWYFVASQGDSYYVKQLNNLGFKLTPKALSEAKALGKQYVDEYYDAEDEDF